MKWERKTISDLCEIKGGTRLPKNHELIEVETNHPYIRARDIGNGIIDFSKPVYLQESTFNFISRYVVKADDIVLTIVGANIGDVGLIPKNLDGANLTENAVKLTSFNENCHFKYLLYYFLLPGKKKQLEQVAAGSAQGKLVLYKIKDIEVAIPPLPTQRKIATILSAYDDLIENNLKRIKLLEGAININYKNLISIADKNFTNVKLNSFVDIISGFPFKSNYYNENGKYKIVTIKNVQDGFFVPVVTDRIYDVPDKRNKALFLSTGDVIMSLTGNVGRVCIVYGDDYVLNQRVVKLSAKELIDQSFIYALVRDKQMLTILENLSNGTAQQNLSPIKMGELPIRYPSSNLREDFDKKVSPMIEMICKLNMQNTKLREARDILLPKLMNGQIEV
jgi:type I restriction enzyme S subunit